MSNALVIRPVRDSDKAEWRQLFGAYIAFYEAHLTEELYDLAFERLLMDDPHEFHGLVAEQNGRLVGLTHYLFHRKMWTRENAVYLQDLYVDPDVRRGGVGRALIEAVYEQADAAGCPGVYWLTQDFNATARRLYDDVAEVTPFIKYARPLR